ncbi:excalibur calcium-binding domain-containing protein [Laceyella sediminis]|uniref:Excalibur calcium-binding domain-containing protein n=1 Tax=Laceyella sediminis TaxID=573074 RepID=A0ABX5EQK1_9BACL|nr:excalibur calcium-binding domain-containing protein [Laceyella sediminis]PRZ13949.1 excalibur calcium-binding domain-containing protein [Laceyella sediminis]
MFVISFILMLFALVGIIYPTPLHKKIKFKQVDLGKRLWNVILFILCIILLSIFAPNQSQPADDIDKKVKVETDKTNKQPKQPSTDQQNNEQDADEKAKAQEEQSKKNADEATKDDEEKSSESQKSQTTTEQPKSTPNESESDQSSNVYYANCKEARAAGAAPLYKGEPGYASKLDRDGDGVACE